MAMKNNPPPHSTEGDSGGVTLASALEDDTRLEFGWIKNEDASKVVPTGIQSKMTSIRRSLYGAGVLSTILRVDRLESGSDGYNPVNDYVRAGLEAALCELLSCAATNMDAVMDKISTGDKA